MAHACGEPVIAVGAVGMGRSAADRRDARAIHGRRPLAAARQLSITVASRPSARRHGGAGPPPPVSTRVITYAYDGLQRVIGATETPGSQFTYVYR